ncbi:hypothetical protein B4100_0741 [Heyndrickxia coagulans]|nr:hypothetical protein B4100_0741 [Heyndrickxia coagulans]
MLTGIFAGKPGVAAEERFQPGKMFFVKKISRIDSAYFLAV